MTTQKNNNKIAIIERILGPWVTSWIHISARHYLKILAVVGFVTIMSTYFAVQLRIDTDLKKLLPREYPVVAQMDEAIAKVGDLGYFSLLIEHDNLEESLAFAESYSQQVLKSEYVRSARYKNSAEYMNKNKFLLLNMEELNRIHKYIKEKRHKASPFSLGLKKESETDTEPKAVQVPNPDIDKLIKQFDAVTQMKPYKTADNGRLLAVNMRPKGSVTNMTFIKKMYRYLQDQAERIKQQGNYPKEMNVYVTGSLLNKLEEYSIVLNDVKRSVIVAGLTILAILLIFLRSPIAVSLLLIPLGCGLSWTFGFTQISLGYLNTISAMLFMVLMGLGADHGIHILKRYGQERKKNDQTLDVLSLTMRSTGLAVLMSALTTAAGFLLLLLTDFKGFSHLGLIAGTSMLLVTGAYFIIMPSCIIIAEKFKLFRATVSDSGSKLWTAFSTVIDRIPSRVGVAITIAIILIGGYLAGQLKFNYDFDTLKGVDHDSEAIKQKLYRVNTQSMTPGAILFADDDVTAGKIIDELQKRKKQNGKNSTIGRIVSIFDLVPLDQNKRIAKLKQISRLITPSVLKNINDEKQIEVLKALKEAKIISPVTFDDIPEQMREFFMAQDGSNSRMIFIFPSIERKKGLLAIKFSDEMSPIVIGNKVYQPTGDSLVFAEILRVVVNQGLFIFSLSLLAICIILIILFQRFKPWLYALIALTSGLGLMSILLYVFKVDINFYNMVILSAIVGMSIDSAIHLTTFWLEQEEGTSSSRASRTLASLGGALSASVATTVAGYFGMIFSHHPGLRSIGILAVIGLCSAYFMAICIYPLFLKSRESLNVSKSNMATTPIATNDTL